MMYEGKLGSDLDVIGKIGGVVNKAFKLMNYPHAKFKEEQKKHEKFKDSTLTPLERELETWKHIDHKLEDIMVEENESAKYRHLNNIKEILKDTNNAYRNQLLKKIDAFESNGIPKKLNIIRDEVAEITTHYHNEVLRMQREKAPSKGKLLGWGAATAGTYAGIGYAIFKWKFKK